MTSYIHERKRVVFLWKRSFLLSLLGFFLYETVSSLSHVTALTYILSGLSDHRRWHTGTDGHTSHECYRDDVWWLVVLRGSSLNFHPYLFNFAVKPGVRYRELGNIIQKHAQANGFSVVRSYCGHGIHKLFHTAPNVPHYASEYSFPLCCPVDKKWFAMNAPNLLEAIKLAFWHLGNKFFLKFWTVAYFMNLCLRYLCLH